MLSDLGAVLLLFSVGLETRIGDLRKVGVAATSVGVGGVIVPFLLAAVWAIGSGFGTSKALFIAAAFVATSTEVTARVLQELGVLDRTFSRVILGAAVIDDILAMLLLGVVSAIQSGGDVDIAHLLVVLAQAIGFVLLVAWAGTHIMRHSSPILDVPINPFSALTLSLALCLALADAASYLGLAAIIGAFLAGKTAAETQQRETLQH